MGAPECDRTHGSSTAAHTAPFASAHEGRGYHPRMQWRELDGLPGHEDFPGPLRWRVVGYAWAGFGSALGPAVLYCVYARRVSGSALLAGMVAGGLTVLIWGRLQGGLFDLYEMVPGVLAGAAAIALVHYGGRATSR